MAAEKAIEKSLVVSPNNVTSVQNGLNNTKSAINTSTNTVYRFIENGVVKYYGITNNFLRRAREHINARGWQIEKMPGLDALSRPDARAVEQVLINKAGLPNLYNKINSIATSNPVHGAAINRAEKIFQRLGY
ncbi:MAG: hypothetical protein AB9891_12375 [Anaerolineaceae bacterium]